jgi:putative hemolysin
MGILDFLKNIFSKEQEVEEEKDVILAENLMFRANDEEMLYLNFTEEEIIQKFQETKKTVLPVCRSSIDDIIGCYSVFKLIAQQKNGKIDIKDTERIVFVAPNADLYYLLQLILKQNINLLVVVNEFGGTEGIITKDSMAQLMFESQNQKYLEQSKDGLVIIDANIPLSQVQHILDIEINNYDSKTIGGFVMEHFGNIPNTGDSFTLSNQIFKVLEMDGRRVKKVSIQFTNIENIKEKVK